MICALRLGRELRVLEGATTVGSLGAHPVTAHPDLLCRTLARSLRIMMTGSRGWKLLSDCGKNNREIARETRRLKNIGNWE